MVGDVCAQRAVGELHSLECVEMVLLCLAERGMALFGLWYHVRTEVSYVLRVQRDWCSARGACITRVHVASQDAFAWDW